RAVGGGPLLRDADDRLALGNDLHGSRAGVLPDHEPRRAGALAAETGGRLAPGERVSRRRSAGGQGHGTLRTAGPGPGGPVGPGAPARSHLARPTAKPRGIRRGPVTLGPSLVSAA